ncbi:uncharacterized protein LOC105212224 [Zeugodacus cucurbitae]|uniref:NADH-ubiquinone oxidoreductase chain 4 n=1 Tax=Zeugodacus cucurbitae TaxID=28588 RepID=A0A0A1WR73_ZEUCU|nr:uncharacterized protein LOC105212224 [Zeugodacus cucurbitae]
MKANGTLFTLAVVICCCLSFGLVSGLKCYSCSSSYDCRSAKKVDCNYDLANATVTHLSYYYLDVPRDNSTTNMNCMSDWLQTPSGVVEHMGCIYSSYSSCLYRVRPQFQQNLKRVCQQCTRDGCNPAARASGSFLTVLATIIVTVLVTAVWHK